MLITSSIHATTREGYRSDLEPESIQIILTSEMTSPKEAEGIIGELKKTAADLEMAVADWKDMVQKLKNLRETYANKTLPAEVEEKKGGIARVF